jgi:hypothetical protein
MTARILIKLGNLNHPHSLASRIHHIQNQQQGPHRFCHPARIPHSRHHLCRTREGRSEGVVEKVMKSRRHTMGRKSAGKGKQWLDQLNDPHIGGL